jgi:hypothetical protein
MKAKCPNCNHEQETESKLVKITCSSCQNKFKNPNAEGYKNNENSKSTDCKPRK